MTVHHYHQLGALAPPGQADGIAPFFAGTKLLSRKASAHPTLLLASSVARSVCHACSHVPSLCHCSKQRQQVTGLPYRRGKSCQRHPVRKMYRIPFRVRRSSALGRPRCLGGGSSGPSRAHSALLSSWAIAITPRAKIMAIAYTMFWIFETTSTTKGDFDK